MDNYAIWTLVLVIVLFQASLGLTLNVAISMTGYSMGKQINKRRLTWLLTSFGLGAGFIASLVMSTIYAIFIEIEYYFGNFYQNEKYWLGLTTLLIAQILLMIAIVINNNQNNPWTRRYFKTYLLKRSNTTKSPVEAFALGMTSFLANFWLILIPICFLIPLLLSKVGFLITILWFGIGISLPVFGLLFSVKFDISIAKIHQLAINNRRIFQSLSFVLLFCLLFILFSQEL